MSPNGLFLLHRQIFRPVKVSKICCNGTHLEKCGEVATWGDYSCAIKCDGEEWLRLACLDRSTRTEDTLIDEQMSAHIVERLSQPNWKAALQHPHVQEVQVVDVESVDLPILRYKAFATPYSSYGNVLDYVTRNPAVDKFMLVKQAAHGLAHLHLHDITHGNVYPGNIVINSRGNAVLTDVGFYTAAQGFTMRMRLPPSVFYKPAEELSLQIVNDPEPSMDVYSWASTVWTIYSRQPPFPMNLPVQAVVQIGAYGHAHLSKPFEIPDGLWNILQDCWNRNHHERPTMQDVVRALEAL